MKATRGAKPPHFVSPDEKAKSVELVDKSYQDAVQTVRI
jgi:hypothetical protein